MLRLPDPDQFPDASRSCTYRICSPSEISEFGEYIVEVVVVAPVVRLLSSSLKRYVPFPAAASWDQVQTGRAVFAGDAPATAGFAGGVMSTMMAKLPVSDQLPIASFSCT